MERVREIEALARARDADVAESALLLDLVLVVHRPGVREHALLHAGQEHGRELESLGRVECHQGHPRALVLQLVDVGHQRDPVEEPLERRARFGAHVVLGGRDQLLEIFQACLGLWRTLDA